jgi:hypothetical protein
MKSILEDSTIVPEMKLQQYYNTLRRYETLQEDTAHVPVPVTVKEPKKAPSVEPKPLPVPENEVLETVPKTQRQNAKLLLKYIKENPEISWNDQKELVYRGNRIPGSNIFDLISDTTRNRKHQIPAVGWQEFTEALMTQNIPQGAIGNKQRWGYIRNVQDYPLEEEEEEHLQSFVDAYSPSPSAASILTSSGSSRKKKKKKQASEKAVTPKNTRKLKWDTLPT